MMPFFWEHATYGIFFLTLFKVKKNIWYVWLIMLIAVIILANLPDIDVIISLFFTGNGANHRGITHSLLFVAGITIVTIIFFRKRFFSVFKNNPLLIFFILLSHNLIDCLESGKWGNFFWPLTKYIATVDGKITYEYVIESMTYFDIRIIYIISIAAVLNLAKKFLI